LEILEYCAPDQVILREDGGPSDSLSRSSEARVYGAPFSCAWCGSFLFIFNMKFQNKKLRKRGALLKVAGSLFGFKHSPDTIAKMKNRIRTEDEKIKHLEQLKRLHESPEHKEQLNRIHLSMIKRKWTESIFFFRAKPDGNTKYFGGSV